MNNSINSNVRTVDILGVNTVSSNNNSNTNMNNEIETIDLTSKNVRDVSISDQEKVRLSNELNNQQMLIDKGKKIVDLASNYQGTRYVSGGNDLINGVDCSGFTKLVFQEFGIELPRTANEQRNYGITVSSLDEAIPGDLLCFKGHVGIYMGDNKMIHASSGSGKVRIQENLDLYFHDMPLITIKRLIN